MRYSASTLNTLTKCGHKYYLTKVMGEREPGKKKYAMLQGDIVGKAIQKCALWLNEHKQLEHATITALLYDAIQEEYKAAKIPEVILEPIRTLLTHGQSESALKEIDDLAHVINCSEYEFKVPAPLKSGKVSTDKRKLPLSMRILYMFDNVAWFFSDPERFDLIKNAAAITAEKYVEVPFGEVREMNINGETVTEQDSLVGYFDILLVPGVPGSQPVIFELKYTATAYTQEYVDRDVQVLTYDLLAMGDVSVRLVDVNRQNIVEANITDENRELLLLRYRNAQAMVQNRIFLPACGTDPYTTGTILCGFKCGGCQFAGGADEMEEAA